MDSTAKPAPAGAEDLLARGDTTPNADYERVVREELARVQERLAQLAPVGMAAAAPPAVKIAPAAFDPDPTADKLDANITAFRAADVHGVDEQSARPSAKRGLARILVGVLIAGTIAGAGAAWATYGEDVKPLIASWTPEISTSWSSISEKLGLSGEQTAPPAQGGSADAPTQQAALAAPSTASATTAAPVSTDIGQMLQGMARDIAGLQQGIEQLKAGQEQMARDNAKLAEQLKASQEQMSRVMARASEANLHPRPPLPAAPKPPLVAAARKPAPLPPVSSLPPPQTIAPATQAQQDVDDAPVPGAPRPPKPVP